jgi:hypothetical protein
MLNSATNTKAAYSSKMVVPVYQSARQIQEDSHLHKQYYENHRSYNLPYDVAPFVMVYWLLLTNRYIFCIHVFIVYSVLRQVNSLFHSEFSRLGDLGLSLSNFSILSFSLRSSGSCWHLIHLIPSIFSSVTWSRRHFLCKMWPIQLAFLHFILHRLFLRSWLMCVILLFSSDWWNWSSPAISSTIQSYAAVVAFY